MNSINEAKSRPAKISKKRCTATQSSDHERKARPLKRSKREEDDLKMLEVLKVILVQIDKGNEHPAINVIHSYQSLDFRQV